jgi:hypothetical protein
MAETARPAGTGEERAQLPPAEWDAFRQALATWQFLDMNLDRKGLAELAGCTLGSCTRTPREPVAVP